MLSLCVLILFVMKPYYAAVSGSPEMSSLKKQPSPIGKQIKIALNGILRNLNNKKMYYVRCIKPNEIKEPHIFETSLVFHQIRTQRCLKIIEVVLQVKINNSCKTVELNHSFMLQDNRNGSFEAKWILILLTSRSVPKPVQNALVENVAILSFAVHTKYSVFTTRSSNSIG